MQSPHEGSIAALRAARALKLYNDFVVAEDSGRNEEAQQLLRKSARMGEAMAFHVLAYYELEKEKPQKQLALRYYRKAAAKGFAPSAFNLGKIYQGNSSKRFRKWMNRAAELGDTDAPLELW